MPEIMPPQLTDYLDGLVPDRNAIMLEMESHAREVRFPIIGTAAGYYLYQLARMLNVQKVYELGSGYGYSTAWFARAVQENGGGEVHHVVWDNDLSQQARGYLGKLGYSELIHYHVGEAIGMLREDTGRYDLIFNDVDKHMYPASIPVIKEKLRVGGVLIIDNMLWHGAIFDSSDRSENTMGVNQVTQILKDDADFISTLVPIRDGMIVAYRIK